jgi:hypothetical protein
LNGIEDVIGRSDLADRSIFSDLGADWRGARRSETELWRAFHVNDAEFDAIFERIKKAGLAYGSAPWSLEDGKLNDWNGGRGVYFKELGLAQPHTRTGAAVLIHEYDPDGFAKALGQLVRTVIRGYKSPNPPASSFSINWIPACSKVACITDNGSRTYRFCSSSDK